MAINSTSFTKTPQAGDDSYSYTETTLLADVLHFDSLTNTATLDVMSNDLGGNGKYLLSIDDGNGHTDWADYDLLNSDIGKGPESSTTFVNGTEYCGSLADTVQI